MSTFEEVNTGKVEIHRGDVCLVDLGMSHGVEMQKLRPALIIQNDIGNEENDFTIIAPISSVKEGYRRMSIYVNVRKGEGGLEQDSFVHCGQIRAFDKTKIGKKIGRLSDNTMHKIDTALKVSLDLIY